MKSVEPNLTEDEVARNVHSEHRLFKFSPELAELELQQRGDQGLNSETRLETVNHPVLQHSRRHALLARFVLDWVFLPI